MLGRQHDGVDGHGLVVDIAESELALRIRLQPGQSAVLAHFSLTLHESVRIGNRRWHQHVSLVTRVAKHKPLVACALLVIFAVIHAHRDVAGLSANGINHRASVAVKAALGIVVADLVNDTAHGLLDIDIGICRDFACD